MKLILKNLKQKQFNVEVESDKVTVKDLKIAIEKAHGFDSNLIKLLHNGKVLEDLKTLADYEIKDENVVVMMNAKAKPVNVQKEEPKKEEPPKPVEAPKPNPQPQVQLNPEQVDALVEMGYEKPKVEAALRAANGVVDTAIEYLNSGSIPAEQPKNNNQPQTQSQPQPQINPQGGLDPGFSVGGNLNNELKTHAAIMKIMCSKEPSKLIGLLNKLKEIKPELIDLIKRNEEEFKRLLVAPISEEDLTIFRMYDQNIREMTGGRRPGQITISLTREEGEAVKRLKELGNFTQEEVIQAFIACDKDEATTANYLFEQKFKDENNK